MITIHRVVGFVNVDGERCFITKGDANPLTDQEYKIPPIRSDRVYGRLFCISHNYHLRIPLVGWLFIWYMGLTRYVTGGSFILLIPFTLFLAGIILTVSSGRFKRMVRRRVPKKKFLVQVLFLTEIAMICGSFLAYHSLGVAVGVQTLYSKVSGVSVDFGTMKRGESRSTTGSCIGAPLLPVKGFVYITGNASQFVASNATFTVWTQEIIPISLNASVPGDAKHGVYTGNAYVFSSFFWLMLPNRLIGSLLSLGNPFLIALVLDTLCAVIAFSVIVFSSLIGDWLLDKLILYHIWVSVIKEPKVSAFKRLNNWKNKALKKLDGFFSLFRRLSNFSREEVLRKGAFFAALSATPLVIIFHFSLYLVAIIGSALITGFITVYLDCGYKLDVVHGGVFSSLLVNLARFFWILFSLPLVPLRLTNFFFSITSVLVACLFSFLITLPLSAVLSLLSAKLAFRFRTRSIEGEIFVLGDLR